MQFNEIYIAVVTLFEHQKHAFTEQERELAAKYRACAERLHFDHPYVGGVVESIAASYEREAGRQDSEAKITTRLRY